MTPSTPLTTPTPRIAANLFSAACAVMMATGCSSPPEGPTLPEDAILVQLEAVQPTEGRSMRFSPKAASVPLTGSSPTGSSLATDVPPSGAGAVAGLDGEFVLGSRSSTPIRVRLEKSDTSRYFDILRMDFNRSGSFADDEPLVTEPREIRKKIWSSFDAVVTASFADANDRRTADVLYPVSLWYVEDPREEATGGPSERALRFTRRGWLQGVVMIDGTEAHVRVADSDLDGVFTDADSWAMALPDSVANLFDLDHDRPGKRHAWLGDAAYLLAAIDSTGASVAIVPTNPGVTRAQEREDDDQLAVDRRAPHSGGAVVFAHDFPAAEAEALSKGARLFIDFETTWCGPCKTMAEWVYTADAVVDAVGAAGVVAVKVDGDDYRELAERFDVVGYPTMLLVAPDGTIEKRLVGYQGVESMTAFLSGE